MHILTWLEQWYHNNCNGDWEHSGIIKIKTLDNPGWQIKIDLTDTRFSSQDIGYNLVERSSADWYGIKIEGNVFHAAGDSHKLLFLLERFKELIQQRVPE